RDLNLKIPGNHSICMSYDFHLTQDNELKLIEINTNASFLMMSYYLYESRGLPQPSDFSPAEFVKDIGNEYRLWGASGLPKTLAIVDETPEAQRLYVEFLLYQHLLRQQGIAAEIVDYRSLEWIGEELRYENKKVDFVYNRWTDFLLQTPA